MHGADGKESPADSSRRDRWSVWDGDRVTVKKKKKKVLFFVAHSQLSTERKIPQVSQTQNFAKSVIPNLEEKRFYLQYNLQMPK